MQRLSSRADDPAPSVHDLAQRVVALRGVVGLLVRERATRAHSSSLPSRGEGLRVMLNASHVYL